LPYSPGMTSLWDRPTLELLAQTASRAPTPGGGSTAVLSGAFGLALLCMALEISLTKSFRTEDHPLRRDLLAGLTGQRERLQSLAGEDTRAFGSFVEAARFPDSTDEDRQRRDQAVQDAARRATRTPRDIARACVEALEVSPRILDLAHPEVVSDVGAGASLLRGAVQAALLTVEINLPHLPGGEQAYFRAGRDELESRTHALADEVLRLARQRVAERS
jgi:formiminotetrahydrofolate cyclodeaminase